MTVPAPWTGWRRRRNAESRSRPPRPPATGTTTRSTASSPPATSTSPSRWSVRCACSMVPSPCSTARRGSSPSRRPSGGRPTSTRSRASASSTRWTSSAPTSSSPSAPSSSASVGTIVERLGAKPLVMQVPIGAENDFRGVVDLVEMKAYEWPDTLDADLPAINSKKGDPSLGQVQNEIPIPEDLADTVEEYRSKLVEDVAESSEELMETYLEEGDLTVEQLKAGVRALTIASEAYPVFCGTAFKNKGIQPVLDAVIDYLPSPLDVPPMIGHKPNDESVELTRSPDWDEPFSGLAFKVAAHPFFGSLTYVRVYSGQVQQGMQILNATTGKKERVGKLFQMHSNKENPVEEAFAGHIYAFVGLKDTTTGDTLTDSANPIQLESMSFPDPVISVAIEPKTKGDQEKLGAAIQKLAKEDPTFQVELDEESGQTVIKGMGELHLDVLVDRMRREFKVEANIGKPQVAYRETIKRVVEKFDFTHKKQTGGSGQFAKIQVTYGPLADAEDGVFYEFENKVTGGRIPREYIPSVDAGIQDALQHGILAGYPVVNVKATLIDGAFHDVDSSEMAFKIAGSMATKEAQIGRASCRERE